MIQLRNATLSDFDVVKIFFEDKELKYQWLYTHSKFKNDDTSTEVIDWGIENPFDNYTLDDFSRDLEKEFIFMIENDDTLIGYISMFACDKKRYKINSWALLPDVTNNQKEIIISLLHQLKLPHLKYFVITAFLDEVTTFLMKNGFEQHFGGFYYLEVKKQKRSN